MTIVPTEYCAGYDRFLPITKSVQPLIVLTCSSVHWTRTAMVGFQSLMTPLVQGRERALAAVCLRLCGGPQLSWSASFHLVLLHVRAEREARLPLASAC